MPEGLVAWAFPGRPVQAPREVDRREEARQHNDRGIPLARQGKYLESVGEFRAAIEVSPKEADAYYNLGISLNQLGDSDQALEAFRTAGFNTVSAQHVASNYRTFPPLLTGARNTSWNTWDMSGIKSILLRMRVNLELRAEAKDALNHPNWGGPNLSPTSTLFGRTTGTWDPGRMVTLQAKLNW